MDAREWNIKSSLATVQSVVDYATQHAFDPDAVDLTHCYSRRDKDGEADKTRMFLITYDIQNEDIRNVLSLLRVSQYSYTSKKTGCLDAYVFGVHMPDVIEEDPLIYLKFQIDNGFIIVTVHEADRELRFPYKEDLL